MKGLRMHPGLAKMHLLAIGVLSMAGAPPALAAGAASGPAAPVLQVAHRPGARASHAEWRFMRKGAALGQALIATGKLAQARGADIATRRFGQALVQESSAMLRELSLLSLLNQVPLASRPSRAERKELGKLKQLSAATFDRGLGQHAGELLQQLIAVLEQEADKAGADQALRALARQYLPVLQGRLHEAAALQADPATLP